MSMETEESLCSICGAVLPKRHPGINDAWPVSAGKCCDVCNATVVVPARIELEKSAIWGICPTGPAEVDLTPSAKGAVQKTNSKNLNNS